PLNLAKSDSVPTSKKIASPRTIPLVAGLHAFGEAIRELNAGAVTLAVNPSRDQPRPNGRPHGSSCPVAIPHSRNLSIAYCCALRKPGDPVNLGPMTSVR